MKKILITGIKGFLGSNLITSLSDYELIGLGTKEEFYQNVRVYNSKDLESLDLDIDIIIVCHAAVASGNIIVPNDELYNVNVSLTEKISTKFSTAFIIYISTTSVYDINSGVITEESKINPQSNYALSKLWAERIVLKNSKSAILRISSLFGEGMKENTLIPNYVNQALLSNKILVWGLGERLQNFIYVNDVVKYITLMIDFQEKVYGKILLGVSEKEYSNLEIAKTISNETKAEINFVNEDNSKSARYDNKVSTDLLDWKPKVNIEERLKKYIEWKRKKY